MEQRRKRERERERGGGEARDWGERAASAELFTTCREPEIESNSLVLDIELMFSIHSSVPIR